MAITKFLARDLTITIGAAGTAVGGNLTSVAATDIITSATAHGLTAGMSVRFLTLTGGTGLSTGVTYYIIAAGLTATTFEVSATPGGATIDHTTNITAGTIAQYPVAIGGLTTLTHSPSTTNAETTDFDSAGHKEHFVAERGEEWSLAGFALEDVATGDRDPGQAAVEALAKNVGLDSLGTFVITSPGGNTATFSASAEVTLAGGGTNDPAAWQCKLTVSGPTVFA